MHNSRFVDCPHSIWSQMLARIDAPASPDCSTTPARLRGVDISVRDYGASISMAGDFFLESTADGRVCVRWCTRNLLLRVPGSGAVRLFRGMSDTVLDIGWMSRFTVLAPIPLPTESKLGPCQTVQAILRNELAESVLFSADYQYMTHPRYNPCYRAAPIIGAAPLDTHPSVLILGNGLQCSTCMRVWPKEPGSTLGYIAFCGEPGLVPAHLLLAQEVSQSVTAPVVRPVPSLDRVFFERVMAASYTVARFGWVCERRVPGCVAALSSTSPASLALFISPQHRARSTASSATLEDVAVWIRDVHWLDRWTNEEPHAEGPRLDVASPNTLCRIAVPKIKSGTPAKVKDDAWVLQLGAFQLRLKPFTGARGTFANVLDAVSSDGTQCVLRIARGSSLHMEGQMRAEAEMLTRLPQHPGIMRQLHAAVKADATVCEMVQLLEHAGQPILGAPIDEASMRVQFRSILDFLRDNSVVHSDISTANVMVNSSGRIVLVDFGAACAVGTPRRAASVTCAIYRAPEGHYDTTADCSYDTWSAALVMLHVLRGYSLLCMPAELRDPRSSADQTAFMAACIVGLNARVFGEPWAGMLAFDRHERHYTSL
jgi:hypothetical protein